MKKISLPKLGKSRRQGDHMDMLGVGHRGKKGSAAERKEALLGEIMGAAESHGWRGAKEILAEGGDEMKLG